LFNSFIVYHNLHNL